MLKRSGLPEFLPQYAETFIRHFISNSSALRAYRRHCKVFVAEDILCLTLFLNRLQPHYLKPVRTRSVSTVILNGNSCCRLTAFFNKHLVVYAVRI